MQNCEALALRHALTEFGTVPTQFLYTYAQLQQEHRTYVIRAL